MTSSTAEPGRPASRQLLTRRNLITSTGLVAAAVSAVPLLGRDTAEAVNTVAVAGACAAPLHPNAVGEVGMANAIVAAVKSD